MTDSIVNLLTANGQLSLFIATLLIVLASVTSLITASLGIGGGMLLLAVMAGVMPISALIPVHGLVQLGSNANRALMTWRHIDWQFLRMFAAGSLLGAFAASFVVIQLPLVAIQVAISLFILLSIWTPRAITKSQSTINHSISGAFTTFLSMFVGATGPLVATFVKRAHSDKMTITATLSSSMTFQHALKAAVFMSIGFSFWQWSGLIILMILSGAIGTWVGLRILKKITSHHFSMMFNLLLTLLAIRLLYQAVTS